MLILSQYKNAIINLNNICKINTYSKEIICCTTDNLVESLGMYQTEERAKEVLQEIIKLYKAHPYTVFNAENGEYKQIRNNVVYEMPEK